MEKEKLGFIAKNFDLFKFLRPGQSGESPPQVGYQMTQMALQSRENKAILGPDTLPKQVKQFPGTELTEEQCGHLQPKAAGSQRVFAGIAQKVQLGDDGAERERVPYQPTSKRSGRQKCVQTEPNPNQPKIH